MKLKYNQGFELGSDPSLFYSDQGFKSLSVSEKFVAYAATKHGWFSVDTL
jgi:hypothetical protein